MNNVSCCKPHSPRRGLTIGKWVVPGAALLLIPKCPLCVAAYVMAVTGMGISVSAAGSLRFGAIAACVSALAYLVGKGLYERINTPS